RRQRQICLRDRKYPRPGARVQAVAGNGIFGTISGGAVDDELHGGATAPWIRVEDESRPYTLQIVENDPYTYDRWDPVNGIDSVFVAWTEGGIDDSDQYFLFVTMENPNNIDQTWMNSKLPKAIALGNLRPNILDDGTAVHRVGLLLDPDEGVAHPGALTQSMDDTDPDLQEGEQVYVLVAAADYSGNLSLRFDQNSQANHLFGAFLVGPLCAPRDFISDASMPAEPDPNEWDSDVIHVVGDSTATGIAYFVYGDPGAIPCSADSVVAFRSGAGVDQANWLGAVPVNADGSFSFLDIDETRLQDDDRYIFLRTRTGLDYSDATPIIFDRSYPYVQANPATSWPDYIFDPWNPYRIYGDGDYLSLIHISE
ncbi:MAG: hypothetical protein QUU85_14495, partial [Candidatus Eisenbacteria bacterium]|nr:hypothetical protein [Candidatus Eisenbacteria bacterium]